MTDAELKTATIFDFTDDVSILEDVTGIIPGIEGQKEHYIENATLSAKAMDLVSYAGKTENKKLTAQLERVFGDLMAASFNE